MSETRLREPSLADKFRELANAKRDDLVGKKSDDELVWATERLKEALPLFEQIARQGGTVAYIDIPDPDLVRIPGEPKPVLKGGAHVVAERLLGQGFEVDLFQRHAGHPRGEYALAVRW